MNSSVVSEDEIDIRVEPDHQKSDSPYFVNLNIKYTPTYPDELPLISISSIKGDLNEQELKECQDRLTKQALDHLGMAMVFTLSQQLSEILGQVLKERKQRIEKEESEQTRIQEEIEAKKTKGTPVTKETFEIWKLNFEKEMDQQFQKLEQERLKVLALKEREEVKKFLLKPTGRELFENATNASLITSDAAFVDDDDDDDAVEVDYSQYDRTKAFTQEEEDEDDQRIKMGHWSDDE
ncbi:hypothetical protein OIO90_000017 [Microbotryomycetes sp. JL221]|nr:hypothetical protein OIO90_000017 [Microbotryomycetes sp. JL221]